MHGINKEILSEINNIKDASDEMREFLGWVINYERDNIEKDRPNFKVDIEKQLKALLKEE